MKTINLKPVNEMSAQNLQSALYNVGIETYEDNKEKLVKLCEDHDLVEEIAEELLKELNDAKTTWEVIISSGSGTKQVIFEGIYEDCIMLYDEDLEKGYILDENEFEWNIDLEKSL